MIKKFLQWLARKRGKTPASLQPIILRSGGDSLSPRKPERQDAARVKVSEVEMNVAVRSVVNVMAIEGLITRDQAKEFLETHAVVVAYRGCGLSGLLKGIGVSEDDIKANRSRVMVVRLPVHDHYTGNRRD